MRDLTNLAALVNFRFLASAVWTTAEAVASSRRVADDGARHSRPRNENYCPRSISRVSHTRNI